MTRPIAFISGPLNGDIDKNRAVAAEAGRVLMAKGYAPIVPHTMFAGCENLGLETEIMDCCLEIIPRSNCIIMLPGWKSSLNSCKEWTCAQENGLPVYGLSEVPDAKDFERDILAGVIADLKARRRLGVNAYGKPLRKGGGNNAQVDAYEEACDLVMYLKQAIEETDRKLIV